MTIGYLDDDYLSKHSHLEQTTNIHPDTEIHKQVAFTIRLVNSQLKASETEARFALAAGVQGKYWDVLRLLLDASLDLSSK